MGTRAASEQQTALGRMEIGSWSDTCWEAWRLPSGQGIRWLEARAVREGLGWGKRSRETPRGPAPALPKETVGAGGLRSVGQQTPEVCRDGPCPLNQGLCQAWS